MRTATTWRRTRMLSVNGVVVLVKLGGKRVRWSGGDGDEEEGEDEWE